MTQKLDEVLEAARQLPREEQIRLVEELQDEWAAVETDTRRRAMQRFLARAGSGHSDFTDVSLNKTKHVADVTASK